MKRTQSISQNFLQIKPIIERHASFVFRRLPHNDREDAIAEAVAVAYKSYLRLLQRGRNPFEFPTLLAQRAAQHVLDGRCIGSRRHKRDVFTRAKKADSDCRLQSLPQDHDPQWLDALVDNRYTPIPEQVSFRCDFPIWLNTLSPRDRTIATLLAVGHSTKLLASRFGLSSARISQLRAELSASWRHFHGETNFPPRL